jgi:hypothetical protein
MLLFFDKSIENWQHTLDYKFCIENLKNKLNGFTIYQQKSKATSHHQKCAEIYISIDRLQLQRYVSGQRIAPADDTMFGYCSDISTTWNLIVDFLHNNIRLQPATTQTGDWCRSLKCDHVCRYQ